MERYSFKDTLGSSRPNWSDVAWQRRTGNGYQHDQDLVAVFMNTFRYYEDKVKMFWDDRKEFDKQTIDELIFDFNQHFAPSGRVEGVQYFDDLLRMLIQKYEVDLATSTEVTKNKRGPYKKSQSQKEQVIAYYKSEVRDAIAKSLRLGKEPDRNKIEKPILERITENKNYSDRSLRDHLSAQKRQELFGEIRRQISDTK